MRFMKVITTALASAALVATPAAAAPGATVSQFDTVTRVGAQSDVGNDLFRGRKKKRGGAIVFIIVAIIIAIGIYIIVDDDDKEEPTSP